MRLGQAVGDLRGHGKQLLQRHRPGSQKLPQRLPLHQLHRDERRAVDGADVVDRDDVGMAERRCGSGLLLESLQPARVPRELRRQDLDRHLARQLRIPRPVHLAHAARAQKPADLVGAEPRAGGQRHLCPLLRLERVEPVRRTTRRLSVAGPILTASRSPSKTAPRIFLPARYVPFLLPRSWIVAPFGPIVIRACRRETDSSSIQTTASRSRPIRFSPGASAISRRPQIRR